MKLKFGLVNDDIRNMLKYYPEYIILVDNNYLDINLNFKDISRDILEPKIEERIGKLDIIGDDNKNLKVLEDEHKKLLDDALKKDLGIDFVEPEGLKDGGITK